MDETMFDPLNLSSMLMLLCILHTYVLMEVSWFLSDGRDGGSLGGGSIFVGGFVLGGLVIGALGCVYAPQVVNWSNNFPLTLTKLCCHYSILLSYSGIC